MLFESLTSAVRVAVCEPSDSSWGRLVFRVMLSWVLDTVTVVFADTDPAAAVTVMAVPEAADPAAKVAVADPVESVVA